MHEYKPQGLTNEVIVSPAERFLTAMASTFIGAITGGLIVAHYLGTFQ